MRFEWDPEKDRANQSKHGISFDDAKELFTSGLDYLEIYDAEHSHGEDRFIAIGQIERGTAVIAYTERQENLIRIVSARMATAAENRRFEAYWRGQR